MAPVPERGTFFLSVEEDGVIVQVEVWVDLKEHFHRQENNIGAIQKVHILGALISLDGTELAPVQDRYERSIRAASELRLASTVEDPDGGLWARSQAVAPLEVVGIEVRAATWKRAFKSANRWSGHAARTIRLPGWNEADPITLSEASAYGIGVAIGTNAVPALEPLVFMPTYWGAGRWLVAERLYAELLAAEVLNT